MRNNLETIREAETKVKKMGILCAHIQKAFSGVKLGVGIGLFEAQAIDGYESTAIRKQMREKDETDNWERIEPKHLNACFSSLSFFDALGMRFHLPAFMIADLTGKYDQGMEFTLTYLTEHTRNKFDLLNREQRQVVREFLQFLHTDPEAEFYIDDIERALKEYWVEP